MFGLMRRAPRLPYCGTCKTMGALYGQRTRALLNHDTVFLAEVLLAVSETPQWGGAYRSFNCLSMPKAEEMPVALEFAATAAVVLAQFRVKDQAQDSRRARWRVALRLLAPSYRRAVARLRAWNFPVEELAAVLATQSEREARPESLAHVAEPTAVATALFFAHGARLVGREDLFRSLYDLGHHFGTLIYTLDAHEDCARDARSGDFNPLLRFSSLDGEQEILRLTRVLEAELPGGFGPRLRANVEERLGLRPRVLQSACRGGRAQRWASAVRFAHQMREREHAGVLVLASTAVVAFLVPHHARAAESWRQCMGLGLNLMALGAVFATSPAVPEPPNPDAPKKRYQPAGSSCCCGDGDCDCDCPCDGCDCS